MELNADLHIHSRFAMATSPSLSPETIIWGCRVKGLGAIATGDALHPVWRKMWEDYLAENETSDIVVVPQTEVEDSARVHHVILMESLSGFEELQERLTPFCSHLKTAGRPHIYATGQAISEIVHELGGYIGPAHAFTPWTSLFAAYDLPSKCYGDAGFDFCELGLSADSSYGAGIEEFSNTPFLTNSDAHSQYPTKLGREFTRLALKSKTPRDVLDSVVQGNITLNAGFFPEEGKYNRTACTRCYKQFSYEEAKALNWKCPDDNGRIKIGVRERALAMSSMSVDEIEATNHRPPYLKMIPLGDVIARVLGVSSPNTKKAVALYNQFIERFGNELAVLLEARGDEMAEISAGVSSAVISMREGRVILHPGGGGKYGSFEFPVSSTF